MATEEIDLWDPDLGKTQVDTRKQGCSSNDFESASPQRVQSLEQDLNEAELDEYIISVPMQKPLRHTDMSSTPTKKRSLEGIASPASTAPRQKRRRAIATSKQSPHHEQHDTAWRVPTKASSSTEYEHGLSQWNLPSEEGSSTPSTPSTSKTLKTVTGGSVGWLGTDARVWRIGSKSPAMGRPWL